MDHGQVAAASTCQVERLWNTSDVKQEGIKGWRAYFGNIGVPQKSANRNTIHRKDVQQCRVERNEGSAAFYKEQQKDSKVSETSKREVRLSLNLCT